MTLNIKKNIKKKQSKVHKSRKTKKNNIRKRKTSKRKTSKRKTSKKDKQKGGKCDYVMMKSMNLPGLNIPEQYAKVSDCTESQTSNPTAHPNV